MTKSREKVRIDVESLGYSLLDKYCANQKHIRVIIVDAMGYKYDVQLNNLILNHVPDFVARGNPFSLKNISLWLEKESKPFKLCENNIYKNAKGKLFFKCLNESCSEIFDTSWDEIYSQGQGCPFCAGQRVGKYNNLAYLKSELVKEWDYNRNEKNPEDYTVGSNEKVWWICSECDYRWKTKINSRSKKEGTGCPQCNQKMGEKIISQWLQNNRKKLSKIGFINKPIPQKKFSDCKNKRMLPFDFGIENKLDEWVLIEFHGGQHYFPVEFFGGKKAFKEQSKRDKIKEKYCKDNNISLIVIPYYEFNNIEESLEEFFFS